MASPELGQEGSVVAKTSAPCLESAFGKGCCGFVKSVTQIVMFALGKAAGFVATGPWERMDVTHRGMPREWIAPEGAGAQSSIPTASKGKS